MVKIQLVRQQGCKQCMNVKRVLVDLRNENPTISIEEIDLTSEQGIKLAIEHQILFPPAVFIDGNLIFKGKIPLNDLKKVIRSIMKSGN